MKMNNTEYFEVYKIKKGDNIYGIARKYNINPELLVLINGLNISDYIYEDQDVLIPKPGYSYYLTKSGDKLNDVLTLFNVDFNEFYKYNENVLLDGEQILVNKRS